MKNKKYVYGVMALATITTLVTAVPAFASNTTTNQFKKVGRGADIVNHKNINPSVFGTVSAISGNIITVTSKSFGPDTTSKSYTVDATNAKIMKSNIAGTIASVAVGDTIMAQGTLIGTNLVATIINDGVMEKKEIGQKPEQKNSVQNSLISGNGQPVVAGSVVSINGSILNITNKSNVSYSVDATNAKIISNSNVASSISNVAVGDLLTVQGVVNGNSIVASSVIDQKSNTDVAGVKNNQNKGFFGSIGSFFSHIFGF